MIISGIQFDYKVFIFSKINQTSNSSHMQDFIQEFQFKLENQCSIPKKYILASNLNLLNFEPKMKIEAQKCSDIYSCTSSSINLSFKLKNLLKLQIRSRPEKSTDPIYETMMTNKTLPKSLKKKFGSVDELFTYFQFDAKQIECKFIHNQKEAKLIFNDEKNVTYQIFFQPLTEAQGGQEPKEKNGLQKVLEMQSQMRKIILRLQEGQKKMTQSLGQKDKQITLLTEQKSKADKELAFKTNIIKEARNNQVSISFRKHPKYGQFINYQNQGKLRLGMLKKSVTDQMVQEIAQCDLSRIQIISLGLNQITDYGFNNLFRNREFPVLQQIYLHENKIQNIHSLHKIPNLRRLCISHNELSYASCNYMCENQWPELTHLYISFKKGLNDKCWGRLLTAMQKKFPKLEFLCCALKEDISRENQEKIQIYCWDRSIQLQYQS